MFAVKQTKTKKPLRVVRPAYNNVALHVSCRRCQICNGIARTIHQIAQVGDKIREAKLRKYGNVQTKESGYIRQRMFFFLNKLRLYL